MNRIQSAFRNGKAFIPFITCGDPDLETTVKIVRSMADAGADLIELGIPFSDPTAEGPVIQQANLRSLSAGTTTATSAARHTQATKAQVRRQKDRLVAIVSPI